MVYKTHFNLIMALAIFLLALPCGFAGEGPGEPAGGNGVRRILLRLDRGEKDVADATEALQRYSRSDVLAVLQEDLAATPEPRVQVLRAIEVVKAVELWPVLKSLAERSENWRVFHTLNQVFADEKREELAGVYLQRLMGLSDAAKEAVLDGLGAMKKAPSDAQFKELLGDESFGVRIALARDFFLSRETLPLKEQSERLGAILALKPYQARLAAMRGFLALDPESKGKLRGAFRNVRCAKEPNVQVKAACRELESALKAAGDSP